MQLCRVFADQVTYVHVVTSDFHNKKPMSCSTTVRCSSEDPITYVVATTLQSYIDNFPLISLHGFYVAFCRRCAQTSGHLETEQGQVNQIIGHMGGMVDLLKMVSSYTQVITCYS